MGIKKILWGILLTRSVTIWSSAFSFSEPVGGIDSVFSPRIDISTGSFPWGTTAADFDGDGKVDLAASIYDENFVDIFRNTGERASLSSGSFASKVSYTTGSGPTGIACGDFDKDGKVDLAISSAATGSVTILRNISVSGTIQFVSSQAITVGKDPKILAVGDFNGDGKLDIAVPNERDSTVSVLRNTSAGGTISFSLSTNIRVGAAPLMVAIDDLDGDGHSDIAVVNNGSNSVSLLRNISSIDAIEFAFPIVIPTGPFPGRMGIADIDGDNLPDLIVDNINGGTITLFHNNSSPGILSFPSTVDISVGDKPWCVGLGDMNGDRKIDVAVTNYFDSTVTVYLNRSEVGSITSASLEKIGVLRTAHYPLNVEVKDLDRDGNQDLIVACRGSNTLSLFRNVTDAVTIPGAPAPVWPPNGATNLPTTLEMHWSRSAQARFYRLEVSVDSLFLTTIFSDSNLTDTTRVIDSLYNAQKYFWRVSGRNDAGSSPLSPTWSFSTTALIPERPSALAATNVSTSGFTAQWSAATWATSYRLDLATDTTFSSLVSGYNNLDVGSVTGYVVGGLVPEMLYHYRVRAVGPGGASENSNSIAVTTFHLPDAWGTAVVVADGGSSSIILYFGLAPAATDDLDSSLEEAELPPPPPSGVFDARFVGYDIGVNLGQGSLRDLRSGDSSTVGSRIYEVAYQVGEGGTAVTLAWNLPSHVEGRIQDVITGSIIDTTMKARGSFTVNNPSALTKLKMTIGYHGPPVPVKGDRGVPLAFRLEQNYPNPFNPFTIIKSTVGGVRGQGSGVSVKLAVYDLLGREVAVLVNERRAAGRYQDTFDAIGLASGIYVCRMTAGAFVQSRKILLIK